MKVKCIASGNWHKLWTGWLGIQRSKRVKGPKHGDVCTVTEETWDEGEKFYKLLEWPSPDDDCGWCAKSFVPLEPEFEKVEFEKVIKKEPVSLN